MKKVAFTLLAVCFCTILSAQTEFGVKGGLNFTFFKITEGNFGTNPDTEIGYYGGITVDFPIDSGFHIQPEHYSLVLFQNLY